MCVYKDIRLPSTPTDCSCLEQEELKPLETNKKNESFSGLNRFAGSLPGTDASRVQ